MTILEPLQWTHCSDLSQNWTEASHYPFIFKVIQDEKKWFASVVIQGHNLGIYREETHTKDQAKAILEHWRSELVTSQFTIEARQALNLWFF